MITGSLRGKILLKQPQCYSCNSPKASQRPSKLAICKLKNKIKLIYWPPINKLIPNEVDVEVLLIKELPLVTCQRVSWPPIKVQVCLRWPSLAPGQGSLDRGREVPPYCCQGRSSTRHMKGVHSPFYGPAPLQKPLLPSEFMYPIARINNASLIRDPGYWDPWREVLCAQCHAMRSSANH